MLVQLFADARLKNFPSCDREELIIDLSERGPPLWYELLEWAFMIRCNLNKSERDLRTLSTAGGPGCDNIFLQFSDFTSQLRWFFFMATLSLFLFLTGWNIFVRLFSLSPLGHLAKKMMKNSFKASNLFLLFSPAEIKKNVFKENFAKARVP